MHARTFVLSALAVALAGCGGSSTAPGAAPIVFVSGDHQTDTIQATLKQPLVVRLALPPRGKSVAHQVVQFQAVSDSVGYPEAYAIASDTTSTNATGEVSAVVVLGLYAGPARIVVSFPALGITDTARFTVLPGQPTGLVAAPADTAVLANGKVAMHSTTIDRDGDLRDDALTYSVISGPATVSGTTVTVNGIGRIVLLGTAHGMHDTSYISGLPSGLIAGASDSGGVVTFNLDGSGYKKITPMTGGTVRWAPNGASLAFDGGDVLRTVMLNGTVSTLVNPPAYEVKYPAYSRDGLWIYYTYDATNQIRRIHPDGSGDTLLIQYTPTPAQYPSPSPDGNSVAYITGGGSINILNLSTNVVTTLPVGGDASAWSPESNTIAYVDGYGEMCLVNADGTHQITLAQGPYGYSFDWSPDGDWIIARNTNTSALEIINPTTRVVLPIPQVRTVGSPTWH